MIATRNRAPELHRTLAELTTLPGAPAVIVVDNASTDGTAGRVRQGFPAVRVIEAARNLGAEGRNVGVRAARTPFVAFSDDDSWWRPGSLERAASALLDHPGLGLVAARTVVGPEGRDDPLNDVLRRSPLQVGRLPGPQVLGFLACAAIVRRTAFLQAGGFNPLLFFGCEEALLAMDLAARGWAAAYLDDVVAEHWPSASRDARRGQVLRARNDVLTAWLRRPLLMALRQTSALALRAVADREAAAALTGVCRALPRALRQREQIPEHVERQLVVLHGQRRPH